MLELADPNCTILVSFTPWAVFMSKFAIIPLLAEASIIEKMTVINNLSCENCPIMFELADPICTILVSFTPWTVLMSKFAIIPLFAEALIIEKVTVINNLSNLLPL